MRNSFFLSILFKFIVDFVDVAAVVRLYPFIGNCKMDLTDCM